ncbi:MAG TPA: hypothetical protein VIL71_12080 [Spirillospora sp.]
MRAGPRSRAAEPLERFGPTDDAGRRVSTHSGGIARGGPSGLRRMPAIVSVFVAGEPGPDGRGLSGERLDRLRRVERRHRAQRLTVHPEASPAGREDARPGGDAEQLVDEAGRRVHHVLAVVEDEQRVVHRRRLGRVGAVPRAEHGRDRPAHVAGLDPLLPTHPEQAGAPKARRKPLPARPMPPHVTRPPPIGDEDRRLQQSRRREDQNERRQHHRLLPSSRARTASSRSMSLRSSSGVAANSCAESPAARSRADNGQPRRNATVYTGSPSR